MEINLDVILGDKMLTKFMQACDVFEYGKRLGEYGSMVAKATEPDLNKLIDSIKEGLEKSDKNTDVIFIAIRDIDGVPNKRYPAYIQPGVQTISNGRQFELLSKMLKKLGYAVETNKTMHVLTASFE